MHLPFMKKKVVTKERRSAKGFFNGDRRTIVRIVGEKAFRVFFAKNPSRACELFYDWLVVARGM